MCGTYTWKLCVLETGGFAMDLTHLRPPIRWWSCHSRVLTQGEIFQVWKSDLHPCPDIRPFLPSGRVKKPLQGTGGWALYCQVRAHTHTHTSSTDARAGSLAVTPRHGVTHYALYAAQVPFDWKSHASKLSMEKLHVSKLCTALYPPACLPAHAFRLKDGKVMTVLGRKDAVDHFDRNF